MSDKHIWTVPVAIDEIPETGRHFELSADPAMRAAIAAEVGLRSLERLEFSADVMRRGRDGLHVAGQVNAVVGQSCVVTLEPVENVIAEDVDLDFVSSLEATGDPQRTLSDPDADAEPPELLTDGGIDLGAIATEFLILGIDPYPRKPGATFVAPANEGEHGGPFAALAKLKRAPDKGN